MRLLPGPLSLMLAWRRLMLAGKGIRLRYHAHAEGRVAYWRGGKGPVLVVVHGLGGSVLQDFAPAVARLSRSFDVVAVDLPGFGLSDRVSFPQSIRNQSAFLAAFIREVCGQPVMMLGNSMGGWICLDLASRQPGLVSRLVLLAPAGLEFDPPPLNIFLPETVEDVRQLLAHLFHRPPEVNGWFFEEWLRLMRRRRVAIRQMLDAMLSREDLMEGRLGDVLAPTLVLFGREDRIIPWDVGERIAAEMPDCRLETLSPCGHLLLPVQPEAVLSRLEEWLLKDGQK